MTETILRLSDTLLAVLWLAVAVHTLRTGHLGPSGSHVPARTARPGLYWFMVFILVLMVVHFTGLAWVGQKL